MAFTYDDALSTDRDRVRFHLGDVTMASGLVLPTTTSATRRSTAW